MKKFYAILCLAIASLTQLQAQAPQGFNYQATVRSSSGDLIVSTNVYFKFNVMQGSQTAVPIFTEIHYVPTDDLGQVNLIIGQGTPNTGVFSELDWSLGSYYLGIELDTDTGNGYLAMGTTQLLSVPYALYAANSGNATATPPSLESVLAENNSANNQQIKDLQDPTEAQDAVTKSYADALSNTQGLMNFNDWDNYQVWNDGTSVQLTPNSFVFVNANDTTLIFPDAPENCCFGDVIYIYVMDGDPLTPVMFSLQANGFPVAINGGDVSLDFTSDGTIVGEFNSVGLKVIINVGDYWMVSDFQGSITANVDNDGDGFTENEGDCDDNDASIYPGATENVDGIDNDCDGEIDEGFVDSEILNAFVGTYTVHEIFTDGANTGLELADAFGKSFQIELSLIDGDATTSTMLVTNSTGFDSYYEDGTVITFYLDGTLDVDDSLNLNIPYVAQFDNHFVDTTSYDYTTGVIVFSGDFGSPTPYGPYQTTLTKLDDTDDDNDGYAENEGDCDDTNASVNPGATEIEDGIDNDCDGEIDEGFGDALTGTWKLAPVSGALGVGPGLDNVSWWSNPASVVTTRACLFDDEYIFGADGSFQNVLGATTWVEAWQGTDPEDCGTPVAPHDGTATATYFYDATAGTITINGTGAFLGLAKVVNGAEIASPADAASSIMYIATLSDDGLTLDLDIEVAGGGYWSFKLARQ